MTNQPSNYAAEVEAAIGLNVGNGGGVEGVQAARDAVLAVRDREVEQLRAELDRVHLRACRTAEILRHAEGRSVKAEAAIERVKDVAADMRGITGVRFWADVLNKALDQPQPATTEA